MSIKMDEAVRKAELDEMKSLADWVEKEIQSGREAKMKLAVAQMEIATLRKRLEYAEEQLGRKAVEA